MHLLFISVVISLILLMSVLIFIIIMNQNKEFITKRFNNKLILLYIRSQYFVAKISLIVLPLLIKFGLLELFVG